MEQLQHVSSFLRVIFNYLSTVRRRWSGRNDFISGSVRWLQSCRTELGAPIRISFQVIQNPSNHFCYHCEMTWPPRYDATWRSRFFKDITYPAKQEQPQHQKRTLPPAADVFPPKDSPLVSPVSAVTVSIRRPVGVHSSHGRYLQHQGRPPEDQATS